MKKEKYWTDNDEYEPLIFNVDALMSPLEIVAKLNQQEKDNARLREALQSILEAESPRDMYDIAKEAIE